nr:hypothetical protein [uncultured Trichococcus sp.]
MNETQAYIGAIVKTRFAYHDLEKNTIAFKSRPFLIVGAEYDTLPSDLTAFPISKVSASQNIDPVHDIKVERERYPKLSLNAEVSYIRVHKIQTIHSSQLAIGILSSLNEDYPDLYAEVKAAYRDFSGGLF